MTLSNHSRYYGLDTIEADGRVGIVQRPIPKDAALAGALFHRLKGDESIDELARRYYGREDLWWRIADANPSRHPLDWRAGELIVIPPVVGATRTTRR